VAVVIDDANGNAQVDAGEESVPEVTVCLESPGASEPVEPWNFAVPGTCQQTDRSGSTTFGKIGDGDYTVRVDLPSRLEATWGIGSAQPVTVKEGDTVTVTLLVRRPDSVGISGCAAISC
jgi:hypothetical protein